MTDIFMLSVRQLTGKWRTAIMLALAAIPVVQALIASRFADDLDSEAIDAVLINGMLVSAVMPLIVLGVATASFANEVEDRTLSNLTLTPVQRWRIVAPKLLAAIATSAPAPVLSGLASLSLLMSAADLPGAGESGAALAVGLLVGVALYAAAFLWVGLMTTRALWFGLLYVFLWEGLFSTFVSGIRYLSIKQYVIGIIHGLDNSRFADASNLLSAPVAFGMAAGVFAVFTILSVRRLQTMDVP